MMKFKKTFNMQQLNYDIMPAVTEWQLSTEKECIKYRGEFF